MNTDTKSDSKSFGRGQFDAFPDGISEIVESYLQTKAHSPSLLRNTRSHLRQFFEQVSKHPFEVRLADWRLFATYLNSTGKSYDSKKVITSSLRSFFEYIDVLAEDAGIPFKKPIPKLEYCCLTRDSPDVMRAKRNRAKRFLSDDKLTSILEVARASSYKFYIMLLLLTHTGMRVNEMLTIKQIDVHLEQRWLETGLEAGARKSNKEGKRRIVYFFPESVRLAFKQYLVFAPKCEWLFPGRGNNHLSYPGFEHRITRLAIRMGVTHFSSHWFRKTLNTNRKYKMHCPKEDRQKLLNHVIRDAIEAYDESEILTLRDVYDAYHPYTNF